MLSVETPHSFPAQRQYTLQVLFGEFLGLNWQWRSTDRSDVLISLQDAEGEVILPDILFQTKTSDWMTRASLPERPLNKWNVATSNLASKLLSDEIPVIYGDGLYVSGNTHVHLPIDIFGSAFFMLSRYEELINSSRDQHDRFPASASLACGEAFIERPIVDEYLEILWAAMHKLWPSLERRQRKGRVFYTCDVDYPYERSSKQFLPLLRATAGDTVKRGEPARALKRIANAIRGRQGDYSHDPNNTFDWIMDLCETHNHRGAFYFICGHSAGAIDGCYELDEPFVRRLMTRIHERGHEIGMHGSYNSFRDAITLRSERENLLRTLETLNIKGQGYGSRQHYLRWDSGLTPSLLDAVDFEYDTTGGFADQPGFRYGTGKPFSMWDWQEAKALNIKQRPLVVMEVSVLNIQYLGLVQYEEQLNLMQNLKRACLKLGGDFGILWHNSSLASSLERKLLTETICK